MVSSVDRGLANTNVISNAMRVVMMLTTSVTTIWVFKKNSFRQETLHSAIRNTDLKGIARKKNFVFWSGKQCRPHRRLSSDWSIKIWILAPRPNTSKWSLTYHILYMPHSMKMGTSLYILCDKHSLDRFSDRQSLGASTVLQSFYTM